MKKASQPGPGEYVRQVARDTQRYVRELTDENHKLRLQTMSLESDQGRLLESARSAEAVIAQNDVLRGQIGALLGEKAVLESRLLEACVLLDRDRRRLEHLEDGVRKSQVETEESRQEYRALEEQSTNLANLYVASYQLHGTVELPQVLAAILEIVTNLIGSEEIAVFEMNDEATALRLLTSVGIDPEPLQEIPVGDGLIGACARTAEIFVAREGAESGGRVPHERSLSACIPLKLSQRVSGAVALFRLLPQKSELGALDRELFELLATHAATALYCASLHARVSAGKRT